MESNGKLNLDRDKWPVKCALCPVMLLYRSHAVAHLPVHTPTDSRRHVCTHCPSYFGRLCDLRKHETTYHNRPLGHSMVECEYCHKMFKSAKFEVHLRTHTGEQPYACDKCGRTFQREDVMRRHSDKWCRVTVPPSQPALHKMDPTAANEAISSPEDESEFEIKWADDMCSEEMPMELLGPEALPPHPSHSQPQSFQSRDLISACMGTDDDARAECHTFLQESPLVCDMSSNILTFLHTNIIPNERNLMVSKNAVLIIHKLLTNPHMVTELANVIEPLCCQSIQLMTDPAICKCATDAKGRMVERAEFQRHMEVRKLGAEVIGMMVLKYSNNRNQLRGIVRYSLLSCLYGHEPGTEQIISSMIGLDKMFEIVDITRGIRMFGDRISSGWQKSLQPDCLPAIMDMIRSNLGTLFKWDDEVEPTMEKCAVKYGYLAPAIYAHLNKGDDFKRFGTETEICQASEYDDDPLGQP